MPLRQLSLGSLLVLSPLLGRAQAGEAPPRYYVGLAAYSSAYQPLGGGGYSSVRLPFQVAAGYQVRPRLAVQLGVAYSGSSHDAYSVGRYFSAAGPAGGVYFDYTSQGRERNTSLALLARYTLTHHPTHRLQVDVLAGTTVETSHYTYHNLQTDSSQAPLATRYESSGSGTGWAMLLTAGPSVRYRLGRHLEALLDFTLSYDVNRDHHRNTSEVTGATALGLRYRFGKRG